MSSKPVQSVPLWSSSSQSFEGFRKLLLIVGITPYSEVILAAARAIGSRVQFCEVVQKSGSRTEGRLCGLATVLSASALQEYDSKHRWISQEVSSPFPRYTVRRFLPCLPPRSSQFA